MKIYTKTGDFGETNLCGGPRITKSHVRIEAYGSIDELNANLGFVRSVWQQNQGQISEGKLNLQDAFEHLTVIQRNLFVVGSHLATQYDPQDIPRSLPELSDDIVNQLEVAIDQLDQELPELHEFILPSGITTATALHVCRTVCRRAERAVVRLSHEEEIILPAVKYLNRLSDYLFVLSRAVNFSVGQKEEAWKN